MGCCIEMKILDCTLRDGGYYCDWDFDESTVRKYLAAIAMAKVDIVEIGFRNLPQNRFCGAFAYSTDEYLDSLTLPENIFLSVMINAKDVINYTHGSSTAISKLFKKSDASPVDIVRIATHASDIIKCQSIAKQLTDLGYQVMLNLMNVDSIDKETLEGFASEISSWGCIDVLYFADSLGSMDSSNVNAVISTLRKGWDGELGIHCHDNKGQAISNSLAALKSAVTYLDSTILGMGRGAGNARTENLLVELVQQGHNKYFPDAVFPLVMQEFNELQEQYGWGQNIYYFLSATHGIHPTYIQEMLGDERYGTEQILSSINFLKSTRAPFYNFETMLRSISGIVGCEHGKWNASEWAKGRTVLIIGSGLGTKRYLSAIQSYIEREDPVVLCLNINEIVPQDLVTAYVACHETRILIEADYYSRLKKPLIIPLSRVPEAIKEALNETEILDYGLRIDEQGLSITENGCVLEHTLALPYALSIATGANADRVLLAGMDGYLPSDPRHSEMVKILELYSQLDEAIPVIAITPTSYPIQQRSVYDADFSLS